MARQANQTDLPDIADDALTGVMDFSKFRVVLDRTVEVITDREFADQNEYAKFMQDMIVVELHTSTDRNAPTHAYVGVNGEQVWLPRGQKINIPRYFIERLARSRPQNYRTTANPDPSADQAMLTQRQTGMDYPFSVLRDPQPAKGRAWLERVSRESA